MDKKLKHTIDYLNQKVDKKTGFSTPEDYFDKVQEDISTSLFINNLPKEKPFSTPNDYFSTIEMNIFSKLELEKNKKVKIISFRKRILQYIPATAAATILLFIGINYFNTQKITFEDITINDIESWYENGYGNTNVDELATALNTSDFEDDILSTISDESLEDYLYTIDNNILINENE
ncbi:hypothetical protein [Tenacibaculum caenipelagi]|uniref:Uncharacterized protein n=1 Tax=Tenacibaculum caenipelagi TaxID=1325435 RepID=A0A4R6TG62_9FLAO|nr:hypothetical protein [Tenacibaculum caenipelagi]TDQ27716.1 hypothetical protein DFQ07_1567 [Tenacibaculum caenipelagi]